jgi:hypothetical protein
VEEITFKSVLSKFDSDLWHYYFPVLAEYANKCIEGKNRRIFCKINDSIEIQCALMPDGKGHYFVNINTATRKKTGLEVGDEATLSIRKDDSEYGMEMPEEFLEVLLQDELAHQHFLALTPGKKRTMIYIVLKVKNPDIRIKKAIVIARHLCKRNGEIDFKALNEDFKQANRR